MQTLTKQDIQELLAWLYRQCDEDEFGVAEWISGGDAEQLLTNSLRPIHQWVDRTGAERVRSEIHAKRALLDIIATLPYDRQVELLPPFVLPYIGRPGCRVSWWPTAASDPQEETTSPPARRRKTLAEQWAEYGTRPPVARWASRVSMIIGLLIAVGLALLAVALLAAVLVLGWRWLT